MSRKRTRKKQQRSRAGTLRKKLLHKKPRIKRPSKQHRRREEASILLGRFGPYLNQRRRRNDWTLRAFALRTGLPFTNIHQFETRRKDPRLTELELLAKGFDESLARFLDPLLQPESPELGSMDSVTII